MAERRNTKAETSAGANRTGDGKSPTPSGARAKTLRHLKRMLAAGTAAGAAGLAACECGNVVCDPLPPPIECQNNPTTRDFMRWINPAAKWAAAGQDFLVRMNLAINYYQEPNFGFSGDPRVSGGTLAEVQRTAKTLLFEVVPAAGATEIDVDIPLDCQGVSEAMLLRLDVSGTPADGASIPVVWRE